MLAPRNTPGVWAAYIEWASQLTTLVVKRASRLGIRLTASTPSAKRRGKNAKAGRSTSLLPALKGWIFQLHERAVSRHPESKELWFAYLEALERDSATRRWRKVATRALRMHPAEGRLWIYVGECTAEGLRVVEWREGASGLERRERRGDGDMERARAVWVRACGFCCDDATGGPDVWTSYARSEMEWLRRVEEKLAKKNGTRRSVTLGRNEDTSEHVVLEDQPGETELKEALGGGKRKADDDMIRFDSEDEDDMDDDGRLVLPELPDPASAPKQPAVSTVDISSSTPKKPNPALEGALPLAVFTHSLKQPFASLSSCALFFDVFAAYSDPSVPTSFVTCGPRLTQHVLATMVSHFGESAARATRLACWTREPIAAVTRINSPEFARGMRAVLDRLSEARAKVELARDAKARGEYEGLVAAWVEGLREKGAKERAEGLDEGIKQVFDVLLEDLRRSQPQKT